MRQRLGTTVMVKVSLILLAGFICLFYFANVQASRTYWENIGPQWDRMLNPINYEMRERENG